MFGATIELMIDERGGAPERSAAGAATGPASGQGARGRSWAVFLGVALLVIVADQVSKRLIDSHLELGESWPSASWPVHLVHFANSGAAFSILQNQSTFLVFTSLVGLGAILLFFLYPPFEHILMRVVLGMMLGGAIGNLIDRVRYGSVTDFIAFPHYPAFNIADSSIVIGVAILIWSLVFQDTHRDRPKP